MQFTTIALSAILVFSSANAAPADVEARQPAPFIAEVARFGRNTGCSTDQLPSFFVQRTTLCQELPAGTVGARVETDLPPGCVLTFYPTAGCNDLNSITVPVGTPTHNCFQEIRGGTNVTSVQANSACLG
ncbi:hypothetical protein GQ43DRAFT_441825 [Delitschia confertaspora ATCC 74209]|uniref:Uncharacterized protein n=1 Tax=Delitschia confertaspora ATCC 74209 TaxID=1513339 RepID=A0A9P4JJC3_9PLEO|nr:hypothetical protein GQ43DRAFT_441825 [Delitschia confertaspora ATCC 74209]